MEDKLFTHHIEYNPIKHAHQLILTPNNTLIDMLKKQSSLMIFIATKDIQISCFDYACFYLGLEITIKNAIMKISIKDSMSEIDELVIQYILDNNFGSYERFKIHYEFNNEKCIYYFKITDINMLLQLLREIS